METKYCHQCKTRKINAEFYKCKSSKDGLQNKCKECCKVNNLRFNQKNPTYYWGAEDSYFTKHYDEQLEYQKQRQKANKLCIVYRLEVGGETYIGSTKRLKGQIQNSLKQDYNRVFNHPELRMSPLQKALKYFPKEEGYKIIDSLVVLKEFMGTKNNMRSEMIKIIKELNDDGIKVINKRIN